MQASNALVAGRPTLGPPEGATRCSCTRATGTRNKSKTHATINSTNKLAMHLFVLTIIDLWIMFHSSQPAAGQAAPSLVLVRIIRRQASLASPKQPPPTHLAPIEALQSRHHQFPPEQARGRARRERANEHHHHHSTNDTITSDKMASSYQDDNIVGEDVGDQIDHLQSPSSVVSPESTPTGAAAVVGYSSRGPEVASDNQASDDSENEYESSKQPATTIYNSGNTIGQSADNRATLKNITAQNGQSVLLHCIVEPSNDRIVSWVRLRDTQLLTVADNTVIQDERFVVRHGLLKENDWALQIQNVDKGTDSGIYECQTNSDPPESQYYQLNIMEPRAEIVGAPDMFARLGGAINLTCIISHTPDQLQFIFWYHDNRMINYDLDNNNRGKLSVYKQHDKPDTQVSNLIIHRAQLSDSGNYTCLPSSSRSISIYVHVLEGEKRSSTFQNDYSQGLSLDLASQTNSSPSIHERISKDRVYATFVALLIFLAWTKLLVQPHAAISLLIVGSIGIYISRVTDSKFEDGDDRKERDAAGATDDDDKPADMQTDPAAGSPSPPAKGAKTTLKRSNNSDSGIDDKDEDPTMQAHNRRPSPDPDEASQFLLRAGADSASGNGRPAASSISDTASGTLSSKDAASSNGPPTEYGRLTGRTEFADTRQLSHHCSDVASKVSACSRVGSSRPSSISMDCQSEGTRSSCCVPDEALLLSPVGCPDTTGPSTNLTRYNSSMASAGPAKTGPPQSARNQTTYQQHIALRTIVRTRDGRGFASEHELPAVAGDATTALVATQLTCENCRRRSGVSGPRSGSGDRLTKHDNSSIIMIDHNDLVERFSSCAQHHHHHCGRDYSPVAATYAHYASSAHGHNRPDQDDDDDDDHGFLSMPRPPTANGAGPNRRRTSDKRGATATSINDRAGSPAVAGLLTGGHHCHSCPRGATRHEAASNHDDDCWSSSALSTVSTQQASLVTLPLGPRLGPGARQLHVSAHNCSVKNLTLSSAASSTSSHVSSNYHHPIYRQQAAPNELPACGHRCTPPLFEDHSATTAPPTGAQSAGQNNARPK